MKLSYASNAVSGLVLRCVLVFVYWLLIIVSLSVVVHYRDLIVIGVCLCMTGLQIVASITAAIVHYQSACHYHTVMGPTRFDDADTLDVTVLWALLGTVPAAAFAWFQWTRLRTCPWSGMLPLTLCAGILYVRVYWMWLYRSLSRSTAGCDHVVATRGSSGLRP
ncbi:MAG TPA: hypothetical protein VF438_01830 [Candidatus Paceibacterota bacterium]